MVVTNKKKETDFSFQFLGKLLHFDDLLIIGILILLYTEHKENNSVFSILIILLFT